MGWSVSFTVLSQCACRNSHYSHYYYYCYYIIIIITFIIIIIIIITLGQAWLAVLHLIDQDGNHSPVKHGGSRGENLAFEGENLAFRGENLAYQLQIIRNGVWYAVRLSAVSSSPD